MLERLRGQSSCPNAGGRERRNAARTTGMGTEERRRNDGKRETKEDETGKAVRDMEKQKRMGKDRSMKNNFLYNVVLVLAGIVIGSLVGKVTEGIAVLKWLSFGLTFGTEAPVVLDLFVLRLTFGISFNLSVSVILFVALSLILGRKLIK